MAKIRVDYDNARANANRLRLAGDSCSASAQSMEKSAASVEQYWNGASSDAFVQLMKGWSGETRAIGQDLDALSAQITRVASELEEKERQLQASISRGSSFAPSSTSPVQTAVKSVSTPSTGSNTTKNTARTLAQTAAKLVAKLLGKG